MSENQSSLFQCFKQTAHLKFKKDHFPELEVQVKHVQTCFNEKFYLRHNILYLLNLSKQDALEYLVGKNASKVNILKKIINSTPPNDNKDKFEITDIRIINIPIAQEEIGLSKLLSTISSKEFHQANLREHSLLDFIYKSLHDHLRNVDEKSKDLYIEAVFLYHIAQQCNLSDFTYYVLSYIVDNFNKLIADNLQQFLEKVREGFLPTFRENFNERKLIENIEKIFEDKYLEYSIEDVAYCTTKKTLPIEFQVRLNNNSSSNKDDKDPKKIKDKDFFILCNKTNLPLKKIQSSVTSMREIMAFTKSEERSSFTLEAFLEFFITIFFIKKLQIEEEIDLANYFTKANTHIFGCLVKAFACLPNLKTLNISGNLVSGSSSTILLAQALSINDSVENLDLSNNRMDDEALKIFCLLYINWKDKNLATLNLSNNYSLTKDSGLYIAHLIKHLPELRELNLSRNLNLGEGMEYVIEEMIKQIKQYRCSLQRLYISSVGLTNRGVSLVSDLLQEKYCLIESIALSGNNFSINDCSNSNQVSNISSKNPECVPFFRRTINGVSFTPIFHNIREIILVKCSINDSHVEEIAAFLKINKLVFSFSLFNNLLSKAQSLVNILMAFDRENCMANIDFGSNNINLEETVFLNEEARKKKEAISLTKALIEILKREEPKNNLKVLDLGNNMKPKDIQEMGGLSLKLQNHKSNPMQLLL